MTPRPRQPAFTIPELLVALGIFAIGMAAVATVFPVAASIQRKTISAVEGGLVAQNAASLLKARPFEADSVDDIATIDTDLRVYELDGTDGGSNLLSKWSWFDRGHPSRSVIDDAGALSTYWVPLVRDNDDTAGPHSWQLFLIAIAKQSTPTRDTVHGAGSPYSSDHYPAHNPAHGSGEPLHTIGGTDADVPILLPIPVTSVSGGADRTLELGTGGNEHPLDPAELRIQAGDRILDDNGNPRTVLSADADSLTVENRIFPNQQGAFPSRIWYAPAEAGRASPIEAILIVDGAVQ